MATPLLPGLLEKRELLYPKPGTTVDSSKYIEAYLSVGRYEDALDFIDRSPKKDESAAKQILRRAVSIGDAHLLTRLHRTFPALVTVADWKEAAAIAETAGRHYSAIQCRAHAGIPEAAAATAGPSAAGTVSATAD